MIGCYNLLQSVALRDVNAHVFLGERAPQIKLE